MAIKSFANLGTEHIALGVNSKQSRAVLPQRVWTAAHRKLDLLNRATTLMALAQAPGLRFEPLKHTMPGFYSIRVNDQYRVIFRFENGEAFDVAIEDYHGR